MTFFALLEVVWSQYTGEIGFVEKIIERIAIQRFNSHVAAYE